MRICSHGGKELNAHIDQNAQSASELLMTLMQHAQQTRSISPTLKASYLSPMALQGHSFWMPLDAVCSFLSYGILAPVRTLPNQPLTK